MFHTRSLAFTTLALSLAAHLFGPLLGVLATAPAAAQASSTVVRPEVLARWRGGELTGQRFHDAYDPDDKLLARGGEVLRRGVCKAVFREIYEPRARAAGLEADPEVLAELARWRRARLAFLARNARIEPRVGEEEVRAVYERDRATYFRSPERVSIESLFLRCEAALEARKGCRARFAELSRRLEAGEPLLRLAEEEKPRSGGVNGRYEGQALRDLDPAIATALRDLETGALSPTVETLHGLYRFRLLSRQPAFDPPYAEVAAVARQRAQEEAHARFLSENVAALRKTLGLASHLGEDDVFAAAAVAEGLDRQAGFQREEAETRSWLLSDAAFLRHREALPSDARLATELATQQQRLLRYRLRLATLPVATDLDAALAAAERVAAALRLAARPGETLAALAATDSSLIVEGHGPASAAELARRSRRLSELVPALAIGAWTGPTAVSWRRLPPEHERASGSTGDPGLLFVVVEGRELPAPEEVRLELLRAYRARLSGSVEAFLAALQPVWGVELLVR